VCDWKCRKGLPDLSMSVNEYGTVSIIITDGDTIENITSSDLYEKTGFKVMNDHVKCPLDTECRMVPLKMSSEGKVSGVYGIPASMQSARKRR